MVIENSTYVLSMKPINQVTVDPASYDDQVSINILDLIFTQTFNYSLDMKLNKFKNKN